MCFMMRGHKTCKKLLSAITQAYGRCFSNTTVSSVGDKEKYRKPTPPPRPDWCFCRNRDGTKEVCDRSKNREECMLVTFPNLFDPNNQYCFPGDHVRCSTLDINMYCGKETVFDPRDNINKNLCQCRKDMRFDEK